MQAIICELCGSNEIIKQDGLYVCQHCGTKYSVEEARKLIGVVKIDKSEETENLLILARRARDENNVENGAKYYDMVLRNDPTNWEASFYQVYFQALGCEDDEIGDAAYCVANNLRPTLSLIREHIRPEEQGKALTEVISRAVFVGKNLVNAAKNHYDRVSNVKGALSEYSRQVVAVGTLYEEIESSIKEYFPEEKELLLSAQKVLNYYMIAYRRRYNAKYCRKVIRRVTAEIKQQDSSYTRPTVGGCYVATCVYGSYDCPQVWILRRYRDNILALSWYGRAFIKMYYATSPIVVRLFGKTKIFRKLCRKPLDALVNQLFKDGISDKPYDDKVW